MQRVREREHSMSNAWEEDGLPFTPMVMYLILFDVKILMMRLSTGNCFEIFTEYVDEIVGYFLWNWPVMKSQLACGGGA